MWLLILALCGNHEPPEIKTFPMVSETACEEVGAWMVETHTNPSNTNIGAAYICVRQAGE